MRLFTTLLLLCLAVPNLSAQAGAGPVLPYTASAEQTSRNPATEQGDPVSPLVQVHEAEAYTKAAPSAQQAVLDQTFWRQILAGVIVTVVSTLILRAIL